MPALLHLLLIGLVIPCMQLTESLRYGAQRDPTSDIRFQDNLGSWGVINLNHAYNAYRDRLIAVRAPYWHFAKL
jgi:hypothetical protein